MKKFTVFIHTNRTQLLGAKLAEYCFRKTSNHNDLFDVKYISLEDFPHLTKREGQTYLRKGKNATWHNRDLQSFSPLRFLPPQLMNYQGRAIVVDPDVFALTDVYELLTRDMEGKALWARKATLPHSSRPPFWATSVMVLDCDKLSHWQWDRQIDEMFEKQWDYGPWIFLETEDQSTIGQLEDEWNHLDVLTPETKFLHMTERSTQPWKTGLPVDFDTNWRTNPYYLEENYKGLTGWFRKMTHRPPKPEGPVELYKINPDPNQERFFFTILQECLDAGIVTTKFLKEDMKYNFLRHDAFEVLKNLKPFSFEAFKAQAQHPKEFVAAHG